MNIIKNMLNVNIRKDSLFVYLVLFVAFLYFPLRYYTHNLFVLVPIALNALYLSLNIKKIRENIWGGLDFTVLLLLLYGVVGTIYFYIKKPDDELLKIFLNYYAPLFFYFSVLIYFSDKQLNFKSVLRLFYFISVLLFVPIFVEFFFVEYFMKNPGDYFLREKYLHKEMVPAATVYSLLHSKVSAALLSSAILCFYLPVFLSSRLREKINFNISYEKFIFICLPPFFSLIILSKTTNILIFAVVFSLYILLVADKRVLKVALLSVALIFIILGINNKYIIDLFYYKFLYIYEAGMSPAFMSVIGDFPNVFEAYSRTSFGNLLAGENFFRFNMKSIPTLSYSEVRILSYPLFFGLIWGGLVLIALAITIRHLLVLITQKKNYEYSVISICLVGFYLCYFLDFHYAAIIYRGSFEVFLLCTAILSSMYKGVNKRVFA